MTIPEKLKIGAKVYDVEITNKLDLGNVNYSGEISYTDLVIRICPNAQAKMEADFLHEMIHGMLDHLGYTEHDEKKVDELANVRHMVILDNPAVFAPVREGQHENEKARRSCPRLGDVVQCNRLFRRTRHQPDLPTNGVPQQLL